MRDIPVVDIFTKRELEVIADLSKRLDISEEKVLVQALRAYQLVAMGTHHLEEEVVPKNGFGGPAIPGLEPAGSIEGQVERREVINHPRHYGGDTTYEAIKVIEAWGLGFCLGNALKYICRFGKKGSTVDDLKKARWYLDREIQKMEKNDEDNPTDCRYHTT